MLDDVKEPDYWGFQAPVSVWLTKDPVALQTWQDAAEAETRAEADRQGVTFGKVTWVRVPSVWDTKTVEGGAFRAAAIGEPPTGWLFRLRAPINEVA